MSYFARSNNYENKMIDIQCEIEKLRADLEFHEQKIRIINNELEEKNEKLSSIMTRLDSLRQIRDDTAGRFRTF